VVLGHVTPTGVRTLRHVAVAGDDLAHQPSRLLQVGIGQT